MPLLLAASANALWEVKVVGLLDVTVHNINRWCPPLHRFFHQLSKDKDDLVCLMELYESKLGFCKFFAGRFPKHA